MKMKHKHFAIHDFKTDDEARTVEGWASTFGNTDSGNDIIVSGAFADSLAARKPKMLWQHDSGELIGVWDAATETRQGLYVKGRFADTPRGNEAYTLAKMGALDSMSIGYSTVESQWDNETGVRTLKKLELWEVSLVTFPMNERATITSVKTASQDVDDAYDLLEQATGICDAYAGGGTEPTAEMLGAVAQLTRQAMGLLGGGGADETGDEGKSRPAPKAVERILREAGLSRGDAKAVASRGCPAAANRPGADEPNNALTRDYDAITNLFNQFKI